MALKKSDMRAIIKNQDATDEEKLSELLDLMHSEVDSIKAERDKVQEKLDEANNKLEHAADDVESEWKTKYEKEHSDFEAFKTEIADKEIAKAKADVFEGQLRELGVGEKDIKRIMRLADLKVVELDEEGKAKDLESIKENIKKEWADYIPEEEEHGAHVVTPPSNNQGTYKTKEEIFAIKDATARQKAIEENSHLFTN